jgi:hypothetical protein
MAKGYKSGGRQKGVVNKISADVKEMVLFALNKAGGGQYLLKQAHDNPTSFMQLVGKVLPLTVAGDASNPMSITVTWSDKPIE